MRRAAGVTLVEVLAAMVVAVAAITLMAQGFSAGARASTVSQNLTRAALLAERVLADFESGELSLNRSQSPTFEDAEEFTCETVSESYATGVTHLTVWIKWEERGQERTYVVDRLMRERSQQ